MTSDKKHQDYDDPGDSQPTCSYCGEYLFLELDRKLGCHLECMCEDE